VSAYSRACARRANTYTRVAIGDACPGGDVRRGFGRLTLSHTCAAHGRIPFAERIVGGDGHVGIHFAAILSAAFTCHTCARTRCAGARPSRRGYAYAPFAEEDSSPRFFCSNDFVVLTAGDTFASLPRRAVWERTNFAERRRLRRSASRPRRVAKLYRQISENSRFEKCLYDGRIYALIVMRR